jgi:hypothetical protein
MATLLQTAVQTTMSALFGLPSNESSASENGVSVANADSMASIASRSSRPPFPRWYAPPAPTPTARECAAFRNAVAPRPPSRQTTVQCGSRRSSAPRPPLGNAHTMRSNAQQAATRPERRDPASCCALAEPRRITRHCMQLPPSRGVAATFGPRLTLQRCGLRPQGRQARISCQAHN